MTITRRDLLQWMGWAAGLALCSGRLGQMCARAAQTARTRWEISAARNREITKDVTWLSHEPLVFLLRRGDHFDDEAQTYRRMLAPDNIKRMADAGIRYGRIFFYKGFGLEYEKPFMDQARGAAELMHQLGMKVSLYMAGTMFTETLYHEVPQARDWEQRDQWDHWVPYGIQTYRHYACPNEPAYRDYLKGILKIGVADLRADQIAFDNIMLQPEPHSCRCRWCTRAFAEFLGRRYTTREAVVRRFGLPDVNWVRANEWDSPDQAAALTVLDDPVLQEWTRFRCESLANYACDLNDYVKSVNANTDVMFNIKGIFSFNRQWTNAVYHPLYAGHMDALAFDTGGYEEHIDPGSGALISQIRSYKMARRLGASCEDSFGEETRAAVHMAFGYQKPVGDWVGAPFGSGAQAVFTPYMEFFRHYNDRYYTETDNVADVAVVRTWASMAYSISAAHVPATLMEQVLIQYKVPFDLLFEEQLGRLSQYQAVILAGQECISDEQVKVLVEYVRTGGNVIIAGNTGEFNQWRERRHANPLLGDLGRTRGRVIHIQRIIAAEGRAGRVAGGADQDPEPGATGPGAMGQRGIRMTPPQWVLPRNHQEIYKTILSALARGLSITCDAPLTTVMELLNRARTRETIAHFVNFDRQNGLAPFSVLIRKQFPGAVTSVACFSPDDDDAVKLDFEDAAETVKFKVPATRAYAMIVVAQ